MIGKALYAQLYGTTDVRALTGTRISPELIDENTRGFPRVVYELDDEEPVRSYTGSSGLSSQTFTLSCVGTTYAQAVALATAAKAALDNEDGTWDGIVVQGCFYRTRRESTASTSETGQPNTLYIVELDFQIWFAT